ESVDAAATQIEIYAGSKARSSSNYELLRVMMLWATSPSGLSPLEQDIAERFVVHFTPKFRFSTRRQDECDYFFDLFGSRPPLRFVSSSPISDATRYFDAGEARQAVDAMMVSLVTSTGNLPADFELGPATEPNVVARVLKHLKLNWAKEVPARASERRKTALRLHVVHGYQGVLGAVAPGNAEGLDFSNTLSHDSWVAEDASAGGYGVIVPAGKGEWLRVGVLVAVRSETESSWNLGVIRRVKGDDYRQYHIGIQLISKSAVPVQLRTLTAASAGRKRQSAILLSERPSRAGSLHIVVRRDLFSGREPIEALYGKHESGVRLDPGGVVETGDDFDWLRYKRLESAA
ncbi:MAG TPA: hypothetical protein VK663_14380, partial [Burkholderiales bacterium]|nr:hypothetical protein [Burkholderiales bacterium]